MLIKRQRTIDPELIRLYRQALIDGFPITVLPPTSLAPRPRVNHGPRRARAPWLKRWSSWRADFPWRVAPQRSPDLTNVWSARSASRPSELRRENSCCNPGALIARAGLGALGTRRRAAKPPVRLARSSI